MTDEYVFTFSKNITLSTTVTYYINKIVTLLGGTRFYIEGNKIVVVM